MIARLSKNVSSLFIEKGIIAEEDRGVYVYSFEVLFSTLLSFVTVLALTLLSGTLIYTVQYLIGFIPLRRIAGGFHAKNYFRCFVIFVTVHFAFLVILSLMPVNYMAITIAFCMAVSLLSVHCFAPSEDKNKPISKSDKSKLRKRSYIAIIVYIIAISVLAMIVPDRRMAFSVMMGVFTVAVSLLANFVKNRGAS